MNELNLEVRIGDLPEIATMLYKRAKAVQARLKDLDYNPVVSNDACYWIVQDCRRIIKLLGSMLIDDSCRTVLYHQMAALDGKLDALEKE